MFSSRFDLEVGRYPRIFEFPMLYLYLRYGLGVIGFLLCRRLSGSWLPLVVIAHLELLLFLRFVLGCVILPFVVLVAHGT